MKVLFMATKSSSSVGLDLSIRVGPNTMATLRSTICDRQRRVHSQQCSFGASLIDCPAS